MSLQSTVFPPHSLILSEKQTSTATATATATSATANRIIYPGAHYPKAFCSLPDPSILSAAARVELPVEEEEEEDGLNLSIITDTEIDCSMDETANDVTEEMSSRPQVAATKAPETSEVETKAKPDVTEEVQAESKTEIVDDENNDAKADGETNLESGVEKKANKEKDSNTVESNDTVDVTDTSSQENRQSEEGEEKKDEGDVGMSLKFDDFIDLQTRLVLMPFIEDEGKGAIVASYPEDDRFEGLVLAFIDNDDKQALQTTDFTDILTSLRECSAPICLKFEAEEEDDPEESKELMVDVDMSDKSEILEEKKDDDCGGESQKSADEQDTKIKTPKAGNHDEKRNTDSIESEGKVETSTISPKPTYLEKRQSTPSREHTQSLNSVLDDHRNTRNNGDSNGNGTTLSSGMFALSSWGMRMKAQSEKLLANAGAKATQQIQKQQSQPKSSSNESTYQQPHCDMYIQTNLGTYFPVSKHSRNNGPQHLQAVTTSSLYCIRKSAIEPCTVGRNTMHNNNPVRYSFQWYRSSSKKKSSRDRFPLSPKTLYSKDNLDDESIGDSTLTSRRSRTYSSASEASSCSEWSSSSSSSSSCSSYYSMSTAGVTQHTFSVASYASGANTTVTKTTKDISRATTTGSWIPLKGATGASFQPNTTLVGKKLRCVVTIRPVRGTSSDEEESPKNSSMSGAMMDADDFDNNTNDVSALDNSDFGHDGARDEIHRSLLPEEEEGAERIVCDLAIPIQADMILFNGARQAMAVKGSASFGNLVGRGGAASTNTPATATSACGKTFRIEVGTTRKIVLYTPPASVASSIPKPQRRFVNVNIVHIYCRSSPQDEYLRLTDIPLFQVTARASPTNSKHVDLLFPAIPPSPIKGDGKKTGSAIKSSTQKFLSEICIVDNASSSESGIPRLELEAPNRMTRESFLLALGIANFRGRPAQLDNKKVLYRDDDPIWNKSQDEEQQQNQPSESTPRSVNSPPSKNSETNSPSHETPREQEQKPKACESKNESKGGSDLAINEGKTGGQVITGDLTLSPCRRPSNVISNSKIVLSPISCQSNAEDSRQQSVSVNIPFPAIPSEAEAHLARVKQLEREMEMLRMKLSRKDKIVTELQRHAQGVEETHQKTKNVLAKTRQELKQSQEDCERIQISKRHVERSMQMEYEATQKVEADHKTVVSGLQTKLAKQADQITELEKLNRALQNEKAVLGATVEARESKLVRLEELQVSNSVLSKKVAQQGVLEAQLEESHKKHERLQTELESRQEAEAECRKELEAAKARIQTIQKRMKGDQEKASTWQSQLDAIQKKNQQLKGERNSYKQKNESLSKEVARLCRGGKNIRDIEKVLADHESLLQETELLRAQKRKALEEAHKYRISYEHAKATEEALSLKPDERETRRILERTAELERLLAEMTDYVTAKQMQLDTMKAVNEELQREIHSLAQANLRRDEI